MIGPSAFLFAIALSAPAQAAAPDFGFSGLFTRWVGANGESLRAEGERQAQGATAGTLRAGTAELGQRVGEIVRDGDCAEGERLARQAGDFPLVEAVRNHCRLAAQGSRRDVSRSR